MNRTRTPSGRRVRGSMRYIRTISVGLSLMLALGACGASNSESKTSSAEPSSSETPVEATSAPGETTGNTPETTSAVASAPGSFDLPGDNLFPEGVAYDESTGDFFVSATADGTIFRGNVEEDAEAEVFLEGGQDGRASAVGMAVDDEGRLFIAGRNTGGVFVYDAEDGQLIQSFGNERQNTLVNDAAVSPDGNVYLTDSFAPVLYRLSPDGDGAFEYEEYIDFEGTPIQYRNGFNLNGIAATEDGRYLITVQSNTGNLYRIDAESKKIVQIDLGGASLTTGDGLVLDGQNLYVVRNQPGDVVPVELSEDFTSGEAGAGFGGSSFQYPTTAAKYGDRLLVVNSQFGKQGGQPELPFTVSSVPVPQKD